MISRCVRLAALLLPSVLIACATPRLDAAGSEPSTAAAPVVRVASSDPRAYQHFIRGYQAEMRNFDEEALQEYMTALHYDGQSVTVLMAAASLLAKRGELEKAQGLTEAALRADPTSTQSLMFLAGLLTARGQSDAAVALYDRIIRIDPKLSEAHFNKGLIFANQRQFTQAEEIVRQGIRVAPDSPLGYYYVGRIATEAKRHKDAIKAFEKAIALHPGFESAVIGLGTAYEAAGDSAKAIETYQNLLEDLNPNNNDVRYELIQIYVRQKNYDAALKTVGQILAADPQDAEGHLRRGLILADKKDHAGAIEELEWVTRSRPNELKIRDYLAYLYEEVRNYDRAITEYQEILKIDAEFVDARVHLGYLFHRLKRTDEAVTHLKEATRIDPKRSEAYLFMGLALYQSDRFDEAAQALQAGISQNPKSADLYFNLGAVYDKLNRFDDLVKQMEAAIRIDPKHSNALNYLGYIYVDRGLHLEQAVDLIQRALELKPNDGYYIDSLGWAYFKLGKFDDALDHLKKAAAVVPDDAVIQEHLGEVYLKKALSNEAREAWIKALALSPNNAKLIERFKQAGFGDPMLEPRVRDSQLKTVQPARAEPEMALTPDSAEQTQLVQ